VKDHRLTMGHFPTLLKVLDESAKAEEGYPNIYYVAQSGKIYQALQTALSSAVSGQTPAPEAMQQLADQIKGYCAGPCKVQK
jgi:ABC-type glycerol-3-phosphate transport system substrate-binding protein